MTYISQADRLARLTVDALHAVANDVIMPQREGAKADQDFNSLDRMVLTLTPYFSDSAFARMHGVDAVRFILEAAIRNGWTPPAPRSN